MVRTTQIAVAAALILTAVRFNLATTPEAVPVQQVNTKSSDSQEPIIVPGEKGSTENRCTAYDTVTSLGGYPRDRNRGEATEKLAEFFGFNPAFDYSDELRSHADVRYVIALVPDPVHTHLSLMFDRQIVAVQQAAEDEHYIYNSSWMPWKRESKGYEGLIDEQYEADTTADREGCPGLLLFRDGRQDTAWSAQAFERGLVVLLIGEQPTGGIDEKQWAFAHDWLQSYVLPKQDQQLHAGGITVLSFLGPTFSGSLPSLDRRIPDIVGDGMGEFKQGAVYSGSVSGAENKTTIGHLPFYRFQENDVLQLERLLAYLGDDIGVSAAQVAIVSEDETGYGAYAFRNARAPVWLYYPRDISAVRAAYEKESIFTTNARLSDQGAIHTILHEATDSETSEQVDDTVHDYSGNVTPLSQEAVLYGIVGTMRTHHTKYIVLRCTNPLDFVFLSRFFHRAYPEGRVVVVGQDLLFLREIDNTEFRGLLALSNYPLLPKSEHWTDISGDRCEQDAHHLFESHIAEGTYFAMRALLKTRVPLSPHSVLWDDPLTGYADPFWLHGVTDSMLENEPPTWLAVVGREGYWPMAVLNHNTIADAKYGESSLTLLKVPRGNYSQGGKKMKFPPGIQFALPLVWKVPVGVVGLLLVYQLYGLRPRKQNAYSPRGLLSVFRHTGSNRHDVLLGLNCAFAVLLMSELLSPVVFMPHPSLLAGGAWTSSWCCISALIIFVCFVYRLNSWSDGANEVFVPLLIFGAAIEACLSLRPETDAVPTFYRAIHLTSGVSPLLPWLFLLLGLYLWTWNAMAGCSLLSAGRPLLPDFRNDSPVAGEGKLGIGKLLSFIRSHIGLTQFDVPVRTDREFYRIGRRFGDEIVATADPLALRLEVLAPPVGLGLCLFFAYRTTVPFRTLEPVSYSLAIYLALVLMLMLTIAEVSRLVVTWAELRRMLVDLNRTRLKRTLAKLRAVPPGSLWSMSGGVQRVQFQFFVDQLDALRRLLREKWLPESLPHAVKAAAAGQLFLERVASHPESGPQWTLPVFPQGVEIDIRTSVSEAVAEVAQVILFPYWRGETKSLNVETEATSREERERNISEMRLSDVEAVMMGEEFVCYHYISFIQNILARMRTMTLSIVFLFVTACLAVTFYPFVPRTDLTLWMALNLAIIAVGVIYVYAQMERDELLSYITNSRPGRLSGEFWVRTAAFLTGPLIGILSTQFPQMAETVLNWLQPLGGMH